MNDQRLILGTRSRLEPRGDINSTTDHEVLTSIGISLKRIADALSSRCWDCRVEMSEARDMHYDALANDDDLLDENLAALAAAGSAGDSVEHEAPPVGRQSGGAKHRNAHSPPQNPAS